MAGSSVVECPRCLFRSVVVVFGRPVQCPGCRESWTPSAPVVVRPTQSLPGKPIEVPLPLELDDLEPAAPQPLSRPVAQPPSRPVPQPPSRAVAQPASRPVPQPPSRALPKPMAQPGSGTQPRLALREPERVTEPEEPRTRYRRPGESGGSKGTIVALGLVIVLLLGVGVALGVIYLTRNKAGEPVAEEKKPEPKVEPKPGPATTQGFPSLPPEPGTGAALRPDAVHQRLLKSTVLVFTADGHGLGVLVHAEMKLIVTTDCLVQNEKTVVVMAPILEGKSVATSLDTYTSQKGSVGIAGRVKAQDATKNLTLIELDSIPEGLHPIGFASTPPNPSSAAFSITGTDGPPARVFRPNAGTVSSRAKRKHEGPRGTIDAMQVVINGPLRETDSGSPLANDRAELLALASPFPAEPNVPAVHIDVTEVREFLRDFFEGLGEKWTDPVSPGGDGSDLSNLDALIAVVRGGMPADRVKAVERIGKIGPAAKSAIPVLLTALEGADPLLEVAIGASLAQLGPPDVASVLTNALGSKSPIARLYAIRLIASAMPIPEDAGIGLVALLTDPSAEVRILAITTLGKIGERARPFALGPLLDRTADADPAVSKAAAAAIPLLGKPNEKDLPLLAEKRVAEDARIRTAAVTVTEPLITNADEAVAVWVPLLKDPTPELRARALLGLLKYPERLPKLAPQVLPLLEDPDKAVRTAAIEAAGQMRGVPGVADKVAAAFRQDTDPEVRAAAAEAVVELAEPTIADVPALRIILVDGPPTARRSAALKLAQLKADAAPAVDDLIARATMDSEADVQAASLKALAGLGPTASKAVPIATKLFNAVDTQASVRNAAIDVLGATGPEGLKVLKAGITKPLPNSAKARMCRAFAAAGTGASDMHLWMIDLCESAPECREPTTEAMVKAGDEKSVQVLLKRTELFRPRVVGEPEEMYPKSYRVWAIETFGQMDLDRVATKTTRDRVLDRMKILERDGDIDIARAAAIVARKLGK